MMVIHLCLSLSNALLVVLELLSRSEVALGCVTRKRQYTLMDSIYYRVSLREEVCLEFVSRCDPVLRTDDYRRSIEVIECQFGNSLSEFLEV